MLISDIDGCIFNNHHRAHLIPTDRTNTLNWTGFNQACLNDSPVMSVIDFVKYIAITRDWKITFLTSRGEDARAETEQQLNMFFNHIPFDLHMRPMNDHRCTVDYKRDAIQRLSPMFNTNSLIVDDHAGIIKMCAKDFPLLHRLLVKSYDCTVVE